MIKSPLVELLKQMLLLGVCPQISTLLKRSLLTVIITLCLSVVFVPVVFDRSIAHAQVEPPSSKELFDADSEGQVDRVKGEVAAALVPDKPSTGDLDFKAPEMEYFEKTNELKGTGGALISYQGLQVQADELTVNLDTKDSVAEGGVLFTWPEGAISCERGTMNLETEVGEFDDASVILEEGEYLISSKKLFKLSEDEYRLIDMSTTTCHCPDGTKPWSISCANADIKEEGYAVGEKARIDFHGVPVFYSPYFVFPVKRERQSGFLVPQYGYSSKDGVEFTIPYFLVIDDHTDMTIRPFTETNTRTGAAFDFRKAFSEESNLESRLYYSNESARGDDLRGTNVSGLDDPGFDEHRWGGFLEQGWRTESGAYVPLTMNSDIHLVSDDLFLREIEDEDVGKRNARYTVSRVLLSSAPTEYFLSELVGEYNQALVDPDETTLQRLPDLLLAANKSYRPFGFNPYGLKLVSGVKFLTTDFVRDEGFDGWRFDLNPTLKVPYHFKNWFNGEFSAGVHETQYELREEAFPNDPTRQVTDDSRTVFNYGYTLGTAVERIYHVENDSWLTTLTSLGSKNQKNRLRRIKHVIEPTVRYSYVPEEDQDDLPLFDSLDRIRNKSVVTYGVKTGILGRFLPALVAKDDISELTPEVEDLPVLGAESSLSDFGVPEEFEAGADKVSIRKGEIREIATLKVQQTYDYIEDRENNDPNRSPYSDVNFDLGLYPTASFGFRFESNFNAEEEDFSSWGIGTHFKDDRGDIIRARYSYIENNVSQVEGSAELALVERVKLGAYTRFDDRDHEFIETRFAFRLTSACNCWHLDLGVSDRINPDKRQAIVSFTFKGLGDITQDIGFGEDE